MKVSAFSLTSVHNRSAAPFRMRSKHWESAAGLVSAAERERERERCHLAAHSSLEECYRKPRAVETAGRAAH